MSTAAKPCSILIVEDERIVAKDLQDSLAEMGYDAYAIASSAEEALACASRRCPHLVLMDIRIKGTRDGIETAALLRERFDVPVVYLTAHADDATLERAKQTEPYGYLMKPVNMAELRSTIEVAIYNHEMTKRLRTRERWLSTQQVQQRQIELADRLSSLGTMAAGIAHEVNNPLAIVMANAAYVLDALRQHKNAGHDDAGRLAEATDAQGELEAAASRIAVIVAKLHTFSQTPVVAGQSDVGAAVAWAVRSTAHDLEARARVIANVDGVRRVQLDEARLGQVLASLLSNAAYAIAPGRVDQHTVSIEASDQGEHVVIEVRDTGCGMSPDVLKRIFEPFFTTKPANLGTGLGLAICHGIVTSVGGSIAAHSDVDRGSTFRVTLPAAVPEVVAPLPEPVAQVAPRYRLLAIDDEPAMLQAVRRSLQAHDVRCVATALEALALLGAGERFDLILSDMTMPKMNGMEFYERVLADHPAAAPTIVFLTGGALNQRTTDFLSVVRNARLQKPIFPKALRAFVEQMLVAG